MLLAEPDRTPLDLRFRLFGTDVRVHPLFWLVMAVLGWPRYANDPVLPGGGLGDIALWVFCAFVSILLHEFGHIWMGRVFGTDGYILLHGMGGLAIGSNAVPYKWQRILVSFAGPAIQLVLWGVLFATLLLGLWPEEKTPGRLLLEMLLYMNLFWPILNLLPVWPLDGGMITREVCEIVAPAKGMLVSLWISLVVAVVLALNGFFKVLPHYALQTRDPWLLLAADLIPSNPYMGIFFALFAVGSFQLIQQEMQRRRSPWDDKLPWER